jgi:Type IV secretion-system coupling protein DNA-binding domain
MSGDDGLEPAPRGRGRRIWLALAIVLLLAAPTPALAALAVGALASRALIVLTRDRLRSIRAPRLRSEPRRGLGPADAVLLGRDTGGATVALRRESLSAHGLILGASGSGKSTTLLRILCDDVVRGRPVIAIDLKGSPAFRDQLVGAASISGRTLRLWSPDGPELWNPLAHGNPTELKDKLIATERFTEPHYQRAAERHLQLTLRLLSQGAVSTSSPRSTRGAWAS